MHKNLIVFALFSLALVACLTACEGDSASVDYAGTADCSGVPAATNTYTNSVKDILDASCGLSGCHKGASAEKGYDFSTYAEAKKAFEKDATLCSIHHGKGCEPMPQGSGQLPAADILLLDCWVQNGMPE